MEDRPPYRTGPAKAPEPPLITEALVAAAHAHRQGIPYETGEQLLARLSERMRALADVILGGKMNAGDVAYAVAALIDSFENVPADTRHATERTAGRFLIKNGISVTEFSLSDY